ncbi:MAG: c-type cytochrome [Candidatus Methylopumilus sp.]|jgi:cytochrome c-L
MLKIFFAAVLYVSTCTAYAAQVEFVDTQESKPLKINPALFDTRQAKQFLATGKNAYIGDQAGIASGKKIYQLYSCTQCHGGNAQGQTASGLIGPNFKYAKSANDKGMFETIWHGTNVGMGAKGKGMMDPADPKNGMSPDDVLKVIAWIRSVSLPAK